LIPFVGPAALSHAGDSMAPMAITDLAALLGYAATIVSFLGGIRP
jgi:hypothetical protein